MLLAMSVALVWNLQAPLGIKAQVVLAYSFRLPCVNSDAGDDGSILMREQDYSSHRFTLVLVPIFSTYGRPIAAPRSLCLLDPGGAVLVHNLGDDS